MNIRVTIHSIEYVVCNQVYLKSAMLFSKLLLCLFTIFGVWNLAFLLHDQANSKFEPGTCDDGKVPPRTHRCCSAAFLAVMTSSCRRGASCGVIASVSLSAPSIWFDCLLRVLPITFVVNYYTRVFFRRDLR